MGESNDSINAILLENIDKETPINFSLLTTLINDTPPISKSSTISKHENYINENYDEAAKIQLKQEILREVKQHLPKETKESKVKEKVKEKNNVIKTLLRRNSCECNTSSPCESPKLDNISKINEKRPDTCISTNQIMNVSLQN